MEQLLTRLAADRKPSSTVGARFQATLYVFADPEILVLHAVADVHRFGIVRTPGLAHVTEIKLEDDGAVIGINRDDIVGVHVSLVAVDHEIGILPEIPRAIALTG